MRDACGAAARPHASAGVRVSGFGFRVSGFGFEAAVPRSGAGRSIRRKRSFVHKYIIMREESMMVNASYWQGSRTVSVWLIWIMRFKRSQSQTEFEYIPVDDSDRIFVHSS